MNNYMVCLKNGNFFTIKADKISINEDENIVFKTKGSITAMFYSKNIAGWARIFDTKEE